MHYHTNNVYLLILTMFKTIHTFFIINQILVCVSCVIFIPDSIGARHQDNTPV